MNEDIFQRRVFSDKYKETLNLLNSLSSIAEDDQNILIRLNTSHLSADKEVFQNVDDLDTFVFLTSADPENEITYKSLLNQVNLNVRDGGHF